MTKDGTMAKPAPEKEEAPLEEKGSPKCLFLPETDEEGMSMESEAGIVMEGREEEELPAAVGRDDEEPEPGREDDAGASPPSRSAAPAVGLLMAKQALSRHLKGAKELSLRAEGKLQRKE